MRKTLFFLVITLVLAGVVVLLAVKNTAKHAPPLIMTEDIRMVSAADNDFGFRLLAEMRKDLKGNIFFSPLSLSMALSMAYNGAAGATKNEMAGALGVQGMELQKLNTGQQVLLGFAERSGMEDTTGIVNAMWTMKKYRLRSDFVTRNRQFYHARVTALDLANPRSTGTINDWVVRTTKGKIANLVQPGDFNENSRLVLTNAVYFNGLWMLPFAKAQTKDGPFTLVDGTVKQMPMMKQKEWFDYFDGDGFRAVKLPYGGGLKAMYILLPDPKRRLADLMLKLTAKNWDDWMGQFDTTEVTVILPRFKANYEGKMNEPLIALGMDDAFSDRADFSSMDRGKKNLYISLVRHMAMIDIDEKGTEAAAATFVHHEPKSAVPPSVKKPIIFRVDHPFICAIRDEESGALLFLGAIENPVGD